MVINIEYDGKRAGDKTQLLESFYWIKKQFCKCRNLLKMEIRKSALLEASKIDYDLAHVTKRALQRSQWRLLVVGLVVMDIAMFSAGLLLAYLVRFNLNIPFFYPNEEEFLFSFYLIVGALLFPIWILTFRLFGLYSPKNNLGGTTLYSKLFNITTMVVFIVIVVNFFVPNFVLARGWLLLIWVFVYLLTAMGRFLMRRLLHYYRTKGYFLTPALIVGANEAARLLAGQFRNGPASGLQLVGFVADDVEVGTVLLDGLRVLGPLSELENLTREMNVREVIVSTSAVSSEEILTLFKRFGIADDVNFRLSSGLYGIISTGLQVQELASVPLVKVNAFRLTGINHFLKFILDYSFSLLAMVFVVPLCIVVGILIKIDSKGPVFHRRRVMGVKGKEIFAFKFRTMYVNGDEILESYPDLKKKLNEEHKLNDDPRITRIGRLIRKLSLDEFPQFFNVLRGEMSVVGPRMISPGEMQEYRQNGMNLLTLRPGITGLWQVSGRSDVPYQERVYLDMYYIRNWSIWMDIQLIFRTIPALISRRGAY